MKAKKTLLYNIPSGVLSIITVVISFIFIFAIGYPLAGHYGENIGGWITYLSGGILISVACFFICRTHPKSVWYTPVICNAMGILAAIIEPQFWASSMWMPYSIGWLLSVVGALGGARIGHRSELKK